MKLKKKPGKANNIPRKRASGKEERHASVKKGKKTFQDYASG